MARLLYFDCFSGMSGDMVLGAMLDAGLPLDELRRALGSLAIEGPALTAERVLRAHVSATKFRLVEAVATDHDHDQAHRHAHDHRHTHDPHHDHDHDHGHAPHAPAHAHRTLPEIYALIDGSSLSVAGRKKARALFERLAEAEAAIHQMPIEQVHLHEVGELDSIVDIVGAVFGFEWFGADRVIVSPLNVGSGMVRSAHGVFPVPAPATLKLVGDAPIYSSGVAAELVTPTGALLATGYAERFGAIPPMHIERIGYGAGDREFPDRPNVLRLLVGRSADTRTAGDHVLVIECEIDDMNPQLFGVVMEQLYAAGAWEVFYTPIQMKKSRPGTLMTIIGPPDRREALATVVFRETTTIGLRYTDMDRECLTRAIETVETRFGPVRIKVARRQDVVMNATPEFEDCARVAAAHGIPVKEVQAMAIGLWREKGTRNEG